MNIKYVFLSEPATLIEIAWSYSKENPGFHYEVELNVSISASIMVYSDPLPESELASWVTYWDKAYPTQRDMPEPVPPSKCMIKVDKSPTGTILRVALVEGEWIQLEKPVMGFVEHLRHAGWIEDKLASATSIPVESEGQMKTSFEGETQPTGLHSEKERTIDTALLEDLATRKIDKSGYWLTKQYSIDERIVIVALWRQWKDELGPSWTRIQHAEHFHIPDSTLGGWITNLG